MKIASILVLCLSFLYFKDIHAIPKEARMTVTQLITAAGYPVEKHRVLTDDGYILQLHRIPAGRRTARRTGGVNRKGKKAVLIVHGLLGSSSDFVIMGPEQSLGYLLADSGYDVWIANQRGNMYTSHQNLKRDDPAFWEYSFNEHGKYDLPAIIDRVTNVTGQEKIMYIGYSMGCASFFVMLSYWPQYNDKIIAFVGLAPGVYVDSAKPLAEFLLKTVDAPRILRESGVPSLTVRPQLMQTVVDTMCQANSPQEDVCFRFVNAIVGEDYPQVDWEKSSVILAKFQPASFKQLEHFGKVALTGVFTSFEDGIFGRVQPYNLSRVSVPVTLFYGANDKLVAKSDVMRLARELNTTGVLESVQPANSWPKFNHIDFVFAKDVGKLLNKKLIKLLDMLHNKYGTI